MQVIQNKCIDTGTKVLHDRHKGISNKHKCFKSVSKVFQKCFKSVSFAGSQKTPT